jgi:hypothetical protein
MDTEKNIIIDNVNDTNNVNDIVTDSIVDEFIYIKKNNLPKDLCLTLMDLFETDTDVYNGVTFSGYRPDVKQSLDLKIVKNKNKIHEKCDIELYELLKNELQNYFNLIKKKDYKSFSLINVKDSGFLLKKYIKNEGFYNYHNDFKIEKNKNNNNNSYRIVTYLWYLNDVEEGGETSFFNGKIKIKPEQGKLIIFPASWTYPHAGLTPKSSNKYIVSGWVYTDLA